MNRFLATIVLSACIIGAAQAQFQYAIGTDVYEAGRSVQYAASDPGYIVAGRTDLVVFGAPEATLVKTKLDGTLVWQAVYGQARPDIFNSVRDIPNSNNLRAGYAALGTSQSFGLGGDDVHFVRTDLNGIPVFSYIYGREKDDRGHCLQYIKDPTTATGTGYVIAGESNSFPQFPGVNVYIIKTDEFGALTRSTVIGGEGDETAYWIEQTRDLGFIIVGTTTTRTCGGGTPNQDIFVVKLDQNLNLIWNSIIGGGASRPYPDIAYGVVENPLDGSYTVTGITQSFGVNFSGDAFLLNLNPSTGTVNWFQTYGLDRVEQGNSIHVALNTLGQPEYIVGGKSTSYTSGTEDAYLFKTDAAGNLIWTNIYGTRGREVFAEVADNAERGYIITGEVETDWSLKNDIYLVKTDANGRTGTGCEISVQQRQLRFEVCYNRSTQQVFVQDNKRIETPYKIVQYRQNRCNPATVGSGIPEEESDARLEFKEPNKLNVTFLKEVYNTNIKVFNTNGELVTQTNVQGTAAELILPTPGLHVIHITHDDGTTTRKKIMN